MGFGQTMREFWTCDECGKQAEVTGRSDAEHTPPTDWVKIYIDVIGSAEGAQEMVFHSPACAMRWLQKRLKGGGPQ